MKKILVMLVCAVMAFSVKAEDRFWGFSLTPEKQVPTVRDNVKLSDVYSTTAFVGGEAVAKRLAETGTARPAFIFVYCDEKNVKRVETVGDVSFTKF